MGIASWESPGAIQGEQAGDTGQASPTAPADKQSVKARRAWLVGGVHVFSIDPRRRRGGHGEARRFLAADRSSAAPSAGVWREWVSALQRHTVNSGLARLSEKERQVVTLAYLEGRTNRQIAEMLGVSVSTVRRRLIVGLERLDEYVRSTGTWISATVLVGLAYAFGRAARVGRLWTSAGPAGWSDRLAAALAVGTVTVAAIGVSGGFSHSVTATPAPGAVTLRSHQASHVVEAPWSAPSAALPQPAALAVPPKAAAVVTAARASHVQQVATADRPASGCQSNPTDAAPSVPVGSPTSHPTGAPVTHPSAGGCRAITA